MFFRHGFSFHVRGSRAWYIINSVRSLRIVGSEVCHDSVAPNFKSIMTSRNLSDRQPFNIDRSCLRSLCRGASPSWVFSAGLTKRGCRGTATLRGLQAELARGWSEHSLSFLFLFGWRFRLFLGWFSGRFCFYLRPVCFSGAVSARDRTSTSQNRFSVHRVCARDTHRTSPRSEVRAARDPRR
jgi:hypothetical protein